MTYKLENAASNLAQRLTTGIIRAGHLHPLEIKALVKEADEEAVKLARAIRETIIDEIKAHEFEARK